MDFGEGRGVRKVNASKIANGLMVRPFRNGEGWLVRCPAHDDRHPSLSIRDGENGRVLVKCHAGCSFEVIRDALREMGLWDGSPSKPVTLPAPEPKKDLAEWLDVLWLGSRPVQAEDPVDRYLRGRSIHLTDYPDVLRFHPRLTYQENDGSVSHRPGILALIQNPKGKPVGILRTYLTLDGRKAPIDFPKKMIAVWPRTLQGAAIRLFPPRDGVLGVCEGVETALSAFILTGTPCWACLSAGGLERAELPEEIRSVVVFADNDKSKTGQRAAAKATLRFKQEGKEAEVLIPDRPGQDFNDILQMKSALQVTA